MSHPHTTAPTTVRAKVKSGLSVTHTVYNTIHPHDITEILNRHITLIRKNNMNNNNNNVIRNQKRT